MTGTNRTVSKRDTVVVGGAIKDAASYLTMTHIPWNERLKRAKTALLLLRKYIRDLPIAYEDYEDGQTNNGH